MFVGHVCEHIVVDDYVVTATVIVDLVVDDGVGCAVVAPPHPAVDYVAADVCCYYVSDVGTDDVVTVYVMMDVSVDAVVATTTIADFVDSECPDYDAAGDDIVVMTDGFCCL